MHHDRPTIMNITKVKIDKSNIKYELGSLNIISLIHICDMKSAFSHEFDVFNELMMLGTKALGYTACRQIKSFAG
jgi:hypothetical protein